MNGEGASPAFEAVLVVVDIRVSPPPPTRQGGTVAGSGCHGAGGSSVADGATALLLRVAFLRRLIEAASSSVEAATAAAGGGAGVAGEGAAAGGRGATEGTAVATCHARIPAAARAAPWLTARLNAADGAARAALEARSSIDVGERAADGSLQPNLSALLPLQSKVAALLRQVCDAHSAVRATLHDPTRETGVQ